MAEPQGAAPTPSSRPSETPKVSFGRVIDIPQTDLKGWTVSGMDAGTGRVLINKREGNAMSSRSISLDEYRQAVGGAPKAAPKKEAAPPSFQLQQAVGGGNMDLRVRGYDGATNSVLVDGMIDDKPVRKWIERDTLEKSLNEPSEETSTALREAVTKESATTEVANEPEKETAPQLDEESEEEPTESPEEEGDEGETVQETRAAMREAREVQATKAVLQEGIQSGTLKKETVDQAQTELDERISALQSRPERERSTEETEQLARLTAAREQLDTISQYTDRKAERQAVETELRQARVGGDTARVNDLNKEMRRLTREVESMQREAFDASGEISVTLPNVVTSGEVRATVPQVATPQIEVSGRAPRPPGEIGVAVEGGAAAAPVAAVGAAVSPAQLVTQAGSAVQSLDAVIQRRERRLQNLRGEINAIGDQYAQLAERQQQARQRGNDTVVAELDRSMDDLSVRRRDLQNRQVTGTVEVAEARKQRDRIQTLADNVSQAGDEAPPELVGQLRSAIPQGLQLTIEQKPGQAAPTEEPAMPRRRSYAAAAPTGAEPPAPPSAAQQIRERLQSTLNLPYQTATAAAIAGEGRGPEETAYTEDVGPDAYEQALSREGGAGELILPSYSTMTPSAEQVQEEDIYGADLTARQRQRELERQQREAKERLLPSEEPVDEAAGYPPEEELPPEAPAEGAEPGRPGLGERALAGLGRRAAPSAVERARAQGLQAQRQQAAKEAVSAIKGKAAFGGQLGGDTSNIEGVKRLKRIWDMAKAGEALTFWGIVLTVLTMNIQMINKWIWPKSELIPPQSMIEDGVTIWLDINLVLISILPFVIPMAVIAIIAAVVGGAGLGITALIS